jgi:hypothetical protein
VTVSQLVAFTACAFLQAFAFFRWKLASAAEKEGYWKFYGRFTALAFVSRSPTSCKSRSLNSLHFNSVTGALSYGMRMHKLAVFYQCGVEARSSLVCVA